jgi:hydrogenase maturation protease
MKNVAIIGMGNPFMSDEGVGIRVIERLREAPLPSGVEVLDMGTSGMSVLHELEGRDKVVFVDCALMGAPPGTIRRFTPDQVTTQKGSSRLSLHEGDLLRTLALARRLGTCSDDIVVFGIEPKAVELGEGLSPELTQSLDTYANAVRAEIRPDSDRG